MYKLKVSFLVPSGVKANVIISNKKSGAHCGPPEYTLTIPISQKIIRGTMVYIKYLGLGPFFIVRKNKTNVNK